VSEVIVSADIFDTQPTCGELSCEECNERYAKAVERIKALEDVVRELVKALDDTYFTCSNEIDCEFCDDTAGLRRRSLELLNGGK